MTAAASPRVAPSDTVRAGVRDLLTASQHFHSLDPDTRRSIAGALVRIADTAVALDAPAFGAAAARVGDTTRQILNAVSFPRFVTELITGVFKALNESNQQQLHSYVELIQNVANTTDGFADTNIGIAGARAWLAERFPASYVVQGDEPADTGTPPAQMSAEERAAAQVERAASTRLRAKPDGAPPTDSALRTALGLGAQDTVPSGDPENLVPLARMAVARSRQQVLSTMVMMGLQRLVIESGRLNASMRFHIDTHSAANEDRGSAFDERNEAEVGLGAKFGPWGVEGKMKNTIGYVSTQKTQTSEEMNTDLDLNSSVELLFKTDYVALDRLAGGPAQERIRVNALNPDAEERLVVADRAARRISDASAEAGRATQLSDRLRGAPPTATTPAERAVPATPHVAVAARDAHAATPATSATTSLPPPAGGTVAGSATPATPATPPAPAVAAR